MAQTNYINLLEIREKLLFNILSNPNKQLQRLQGLKKEMEQHIAREINTIGQEPLNCLNGFLYKDYTDFRQKAVYPNVEMIKAFNVALKDLNVKNGISESKPYNADSCINYIWAVLSTQLGPADQLNEIGNLILLYIAVCNEINRLIEFNRLNMTICELPTDGSLNTIEPQRQPNITILKKLKSWLNKAEKAKFCKRLENGRYEWIGKNVDCAYFIATASDKLGVNEKQLENGEKAVNWQYFVPILNIHPKKIREAHKQNKNKGGKPHNSNMIDNLFKS